jgi:hypothetical protein
MTAWSFTPTPPLPLHPVRRHFGSTIFTLLGIYEKDKGAVTVLGHGDKLRQLNYENTGTYFFKRRHILANTGSINVIWLKDTVWRPRRYILWSNLVYFSHELLPFLRQQTCLYSLSNVWPFCYLNFSSYIHITFASDKQFELHDTGSWRTIYHHAERVGREHRHPQIVPSSAASV